MGELEKGISIIICCYNSQHRIAETLVYISKQKVRNGLKVEIVVVDNASKDNTSQVALETWSNIAVTDFSLKVVSQPIPGLSHARELGMQESSYDTLLFCDDDNHLFQDYIQSGMDALDRMPEVMIMGGLPLPKLEIYPGKWIEQVYSAMAIGPRAATSGYADWVYGAGMFVRRQLFSDLKNKDITFFLSDRIGKKQSSGGDAELCLLTRLLDYQIYYNSDLQFYHYMQKHRLKKSFFLSSVYSKTFAGYYLYVLERRSLKNAKVTFIKNALKQLFYSLPRAFVGNFKFYNSLSIVYNSTVVVWMLVERKKQQVIKEYVKALLIKTGHTID